MKWRKGPRPWSIRLACTLLLLIGSWTFWIGMRDLFTAQGILIERFPWWSWNRDWTIVALSSELTIALVPIVLIWFLGRGIARWLVTVFGGVKIAVLLSTVLEYWERLEVLLTPLMVEAGIYMAVIALLFMPGASRWFSRAVEPRRADLAVFE